MVRMTTAATGTIAVVALLISLAVAVARPRGLPELIGAGPAAVLLVLLGVLPGSAAAEEVARLAPTVGFLAAVLVLAYLCDRAGLFTAAGAWLTTASRGLPVRLLGTWPTPRHCCCRCRT
jgi:arsenical pump membrane protein